MHGWNSFVREHHERRSRQFSIRGLAPAWRARACRRACGRRSGARRFWCCTASAPTAKARTCWQPTRVLSEFGYVTLRFDMRGCGKSEGEFGRVICLEQVEDLGNALRFSRQASRRRSRPHRRHRLELRRRGRGLCRRHQSARRRGDLQRRLGPWRAQIPRPASDAGGLGEIHQNARRGPRPSRPHRKIADGAALRHRADPRSRARKSGAAESRHAGAEFGRDVSGRDGAEHVRFPRRGGGRQDRAAAAAARSTPPTIW